MTDKIQLEDCEILSHKQYQSGQYILRLKSNKIPKITKAGQFVHLNVGGNVLMRRPISIMNFDKDNNTFDLLYKIVGIGTAELAQRKVGEILSVLGPIGNNFNLNNNKYPLLIGGGVGIPPIIALAKEIASQGDKYDAFAVLASEVPFPFAITKSKIKDNCELNATYALMEDYGVITRLASNNQEVLKTTTVNAIFKGFATDLAEKYLKSLSAKQLSQVEIFACGPNPMLVAVKNLAEKYNLPSQLSLEEYMACSVGGCAGCTVKTLENGKEFMRKVCVEGPIFNGKTVFN